MIFPVLQLLAEDCLAKPSSNSHYSFKDLLQMGDSSSDDDECTPPRGSETNRQGLEARSSNSEAHSPQRCQ